MISIIIRFFRNKCFLLATPKKDEYSQILKNIKEIIIENNYGAEISVFHIDTKKGKELAKIHDVPEVPCLMIGERYYFRDTLLDKNNLMEAFRKNGQC